MRRTRGQALAVDHQVPIVPYAHLLIAHDNHTFDVKVAGDMRVIYSLGLENDDFAALRPAKIVRHSVDEQMIAADDLQFNYVLTLRENLRDRSTVRAYQSGAPEEILRRKPNRVHHVSDLETLPQIKKQQPHGLLIDDVEWARILRHEMGV